VMMVVKSTHHTVSWARGEVMEGEGRGWVD